MVAARTLVQIAFKAVLSYNGPIRLDARYAIIPYHPVTGSTPKQSDNDLTCRVGRASALAPEALAALLPTIE